MHAWQDFFTDSRAISVCVTADGGQYNENPEIFFVINIFRGLCMCVHILNEVAALNYKYICNIINTYMGTCTHVYNEKLLSTEEE